MLTSGIYNKKLASMLLRIMMAGIFSTMFSVGATATVSTFSNQSDFENIFTDTFTLVNLDSPGLNGFAAPYFVEDTAPAAAFFALGIDFQGLNPQVVAGQAFQITLSGRDRLILNGTGSLTGGNIRFDFVTPVNGIGALSNVGDGGRVRAFSEIGLGGALLGEADFGADFTGGFGGLTSTALIRSAEITCDFNSDFACGVFDIQFGTGLANPVPAPATMGIFLLGLGLLFGPLRRKRSARDSRRLIRLEA